MVQYKIQRQKRQGQYVFILYTIAVLLVLREKGGNYWDFGVWICHFWGKNWSHIYIWESSKVWPIFI